MGRLGWSTSRRGRRVAGYNPATSLRRFTMLKDLVPKTRSVRRFYEETPVPLATLREMVDLARQCASTRNAQPLKYVLCTSRTLNARIFPLLAWAGYLKDWGGPVEGERPAAYIVVLGDTRISRSCDTY